MSAPSLNRELGGILRVERASGCQHALGSRAPVDAHPHSSPRGSRMPIQFEPRNFRWYNGGVLRASLSPLLPLPPDRRLRKTDRQSSCVWANPPNLQQPQHAQNGPVTSSASLYRNMKLETPASLSHKSVWLLLNRRAAINSTPSGRPLKSSWRAAPLDIY